MPDELLMPSDDRQRQIIVAERREQDRVEHYLGYLKYAGDRVVAAVKLMADPDGPPALFHCAAGKDRTGVLAALVLDAVGVERERDRRRLRADQRASRARRSTAAPDADVRQLHGSAVQQDMSADPQTMTDVLAALDDRDGGAAGWLLANGLTDAELAALTAVLTG